MDQPLLCERENEMHLWAGFKVLSEKESVESSDQHGSLWGNMTHAPLLILQVLNLLNSHSASLETGVEGGLCNSRQ